MEGQAMSENLGGLDVIAVIGVGIGATLFLDLFAVVRARLTGKPGMNWGKVGRWLGHLPRGQLVLTGPAASSRLPGEAALGWVFHYLVGILLAAVLTAILGGDWLSNPPFVAVVGFGAMTVVLPLATLQPALGMGLAARKTPFPWAVRRNSLVTHCVFGLGLYLSTVVLSALKTGI